MVGVSQSIPSTGLVSQVARQVARHNPRVVSFDVFSTLLQRRVSPEQLNQALCRALHRALSAAYPDSMAQCDWHQINQLRDQAYARLANALQQKGQDPEVRLNDWLTAWVAALPVTWTAAEQPRQWVQWLQHELVRRELWACRANADLLAWCQQLKASGKRLIVISDMYYDEAIVRQLLLNAGYAPDCFDAVYVSSDYGATKASGRLFARVAEQEGLPAKAFLHLGDNRNSDVVQPKRAGWHAFHWENRDLLQHEALIALDFWLMRRDSRWAGYSQVMNHRDTNAALDDPLPAGASPEFALGYRVLGPILANFIHQLVDWSQQAQPDVLYFLAREGFLFKRLYDVLAPRLAHDAAQAVIPSAYLCVSRASSTGWPSDYLGLRDFAAIQLNINRPTLRHCFGLIQYPTDQQKALAGAYGFDSLDEPVDFANDPAFHALCDDPALRAHLQHQRRSVQDGLRNHLRERGVFDCRRVALVDSGWSGQIQENIVAALRDATPQPPPEVLGFYLGINALGTRRQQTGLHMASSSLGDMAHYDWLSGALFEALPLWEALTQALHRSTKGYQGPQGEPVFGTPPYQAATVDDSLVQLAHIQEGVLAFAQHYADCADMLQWSSRHTTPYAQALIARLKRFPRVSEAAVINQLPYSKDFGTNIEEALYQVGAGLSSLKTLVWAIRQPGVMWREGVAAFAGPMYHHLLVVKKAWNGLYETLGSPAHSHSLRRADAPVWLQPTLPPRFNPETGVLQRPIAPLPVEEQTLTLHQALLTERALPSSMALTNGARAEEQTAAITVADSVSLWLAGTVAVALTRQRFGLNCRGARFENWLPVRWLLVQALVTQFPMLWFWVRQSRLRFQLRKTRLGQASQQPQVVNPQNAMA